MPYLVSRLGLFILFLVCGFVIFGLPLILPIGIQIVFRIGIFVIFLVASLLLRWKSMNKRYFFVCFAFFVASLVVFMDYFLYLNWSVLNIHGSRMDQYVLAKIISTILIVVPIIVLTKVSGQNMASIYLAKGKLKVGLLIGLILFVFFLITSIPAAMLLYGGKGLAYEHLIAWAPWIFPFVLANGLREELLFRGLFLKKYQVFFGLGLSNVLQALVFVMPHFGETYSPVMIIFLVITFFLGLTFGALMQKTNSIIGSVLFHAGADIPVILGIFSNF